MSINQSEKENSRRKYIAIALFALFGVLIVGVSVVGVGMYPLSDTETGDNPVNGIDDTETEGEDQTDSNGDDESTEVETETGKLVISGAEYTRISATPAEGVTVQALDANGEVINEDVTNSNGEYTVAKNADSYTVNGYAVTEDVFSSNTYQSIATGESTGVASSDFEYTLSIPDDLDTNSSVVAILMDYESGAYEVETASDLQAMIHDLDSDYRQVSDIDASHTAEWNTVTSETVFDRTDVGWMETGDIFETKYPVGEVKSVTFEWRDENGDKQSESLEHTIDNEKGGIVIDSTPNIDTNNTTTYSVTVQYSADLDQLENTSFGFNPIYGNENLEFNDSFNGEFDGQDYTINGLTINRSIDQEQRPLSDIIGFTVSSDCSQVSVNIQSDVDPCLEEP